jgi:hypothetical protein
MDRNFHIFITIKYYEVCRQYGLFGVSELGKKWGINQLANVNKGDVAFFFTTQKVGKRSRGVIYGPFEVVSNPFYNDEVIWSDKNNGKDPYSYRVKIRALSDHFCINPISIQRIYDLRDEYKIKSILDTSSFSERSVCNLFRDEGMLILEALLQNNFQNIKDNAHYKGHSLVEHDFNFFENKKLKKLRNGFVFTRESFLEAYLLRNRKLLMDLSGYQNKNTALDVYNQIGTYIAGGNIDIVTLIKERLLDSEFVIGANVIELKNELLEVDNLHQLKEYIEWTQRILPRCEEEMIHGILIGPKFGDKSNQKEKVFKDELKHFTEFYSIRAFEYFVTPDLQFKYESVK